LKPILAKIGRMNRTGGNADQIRSQLVGDPDALSGLEHLRELVRDATSLTNRRVTRADLKPVGRTRRAAGVKLPRAALSLSTARKTGLALI
jgi:hypothetical protein